MLWFMISVALWVSVRIQCITPVISLLSSQTETLKLQLWDKLKITTNQFRLSWRQIYKCHLEASILPNNTSCFYNNFLGKDQFQSKKMQKLPKTWANGYFSNTDQLSEQPAATIQNDWTGNPNSNPWTWMIFVQH